MKEVIKNIVIIILIIICIFVYRQLDREENIEIAMQTCIVFFVLKYLLKINIFVDIKF